MRWLLISHFADETEAQRLWLPKIRESRDGHEAALLGAFATLCFYLFIYLYAYKKYICIYYIYLFYYKRGYEEGCEEIKTCLNHSEFYLKKTTLVLIYFLSAFLKLGLGLGFFNA